MSGGAPLGTDVIEAVYKRTGILIRMGYGTSEAGSLTSQLGDTWEELASSLGTAGKPLPGVQFRIVDPADNRRALRRADVSAEAHPLLCTVLKIDEEGEILLKCVDAACVRRLADRAEAAQDARRHDRLPRQS